MSFFLWYVIVRSSSGDYFKTIFKLSSIFIGIIYRGKRSPRPYYNCCSDLYKWCLLIWKPLSNYSLLFDDLWQAWLLCFPHCHCPYICSSIQQLMVYIYPHWLDTPDLSLYIWWCMIYRGRPLKFSATVNCWKVTFKDLPHLLNWAKYSNL